ncbi:MAG: hypothetical protein HYR76_04470 [Ignavibacteria bacterium]|nr:hypothetical protein [Ignavibacteria bacterium]MBI3764929.1 hypothetical protein [Ignavibacteriales bacterium]
MDIVVDEWLLEYMIPGSKHFSISNKFLDELEKRADRIVIRIPSPFAQKLYRFAKYHEKRLTRFFKIMFDENKVYRVTDEEIGGLPEHLVASVPSDDVYLVELLYHLNEKIFVTTDTTLKEILSKQEDVKAFLLEDFCRNYYKIT